LTIFHYEIKIYCDSRVIAKEVSSLSSEFVFACQLTTVYDSDGGEGLVLGTSLIFSGLFQDIPPRNAAAVNSMFFI